MFVHYHPVGDTAWYTRAEEVRAEAQVEVLAEVQAQASSELGAGSPLASERQDAWRNSAAEYAAAALLWEREHVRQANGREALMQVRLQQNPYVHQLDPARLTDRRMQRAHMQLGMPNPNHDLLTRVLRDGDATVQRGGDAVVQRDGDARVHRDGAAVVQWGGDAAVQRDEL